MFRYIYAVKHNTALLSSVCDSDVGSNYTSRFHDTTSSILQTRQLLFQWVNQSRLCCSGRPVTSSCLDFGFVHLNSSLCLHFGLVTSCLIVNFFSHVSLSYVASSLCLVSLLCDCPAWMCHTCVLSTLLYQSVCLHPCIPLSFSFLVCSICFKCLSFGGLDF